LDDLARDGMEFDAKFFVAIVPDGGFSAYSGSNEYVFTVPLSACENDSKVATFHSKKLVPLHEYSHPAMRYSDAHLCIDDDLIENVIADLFAGLHLSDYSLPAFDFELPEKNGIPVFDFHDNERDLSDAELASISINSLQSGHFEAYTPYQVGRYFRAMHALTPLCLKHRERGHSFLSIGNYLDVREGCIKYYSSFDLNDNPTREIIDIAGSISS